MIPTATPETVIELSFGHAVARALHVVAELGVADHLDEPREAKALADDLTADADALHRLLRLLETRGLFACDVDGRWAHTEGSRFLREDHPMSLRAFARMAGTSFGWESFTGLGHATRTGEPGICLLQPEGWTAYLQEHPADAAIFHQSMTAKAHADVAAVLKSHDFSRYSQVADIGGGNGHLLRALLDEHPAARGVLFDLPEVADTVAEHPRIEVVGGDFFTDRLPTCDAYVLMNIVHDWDDDAAGTILRAVAEAGQPQATVLVLEILLPEGPVPHWAKTLDVMMLAMTGGRERTLSQYDALLRASGLQLVAVTPTGTAFSVIEARVG